MILHDCQTGVFAQRGSVNTLFHAGFQGFCYMRALQIQHNLKIGERVWHVLEYELNCGNHLCPACFEDAVEWGCICPLEEAVWEDCFCTSSFLVVILLLCSGSSILDSVTSMPNKWMWIWSIDGMTFNRTLKYMEKNWTQWHCSPEISPEKARDWTRPFQQEAGN